MLSLYIISLYGSERKLQAIVLSEKHKKQYIKLFFLWISSWLNLLFSLTGVQKVTDYWVRSERSQLAGSSLNMFFTLHISVV